MAHLTKNSTFNPKIEHSTKMIYVFMPLNYLRNGGTFMLRKCTVYVREKEFAARTRSLNFTYRPSAIYSESIQPLSVLHSGLKREWQPIFSTF